MHDYYHPHKLADVGDSLVAGEGTDALIETLVNPEFYHATFNHD
jgi:hypothetical protein